MKSGTSESAQEIVARSGSNLAFALAILPPEKRKDMRVFYAFCRVIDDLADDPNLSLIERQNGLDRWRNLVDRTPPKATVETEFGELIAKYQLCATTLHDIIDGVAMDLEPARFQTTEELKEYCFKVASAVGLISIEIFGYQNTQTTRYAEALGYALQWTNIMRDVAEDAAENRIYLPLEELDRYGIRESDLLTKTVAAGPFQSLMGHQSELANRFYQEASELLPAEDKSTMRSPELMRRIYFAILQKMERDNYRVFEKRYRLSKVRMMSEFLRAKFVM